MVTSPLLLTGNHREKLQLQSQPLKPPPMPTATILTPPSKAKPGALGAIKTTSPPQSTTMSPTGSQPAAKISSDFGTSHYV